MNLLFLVALQCCMAVVVHSAPVRVLDDPEFKRTTELMKTLVLKIRVDMVPTAYSAIVIEEGLKLDLSSLPAHLDDMRMSLGIRDAPILKPLSEHFTLERCLSRMSTGVRLYHDLLGALATKLSGLTYLMNDLQDLLGQIRNKGCGQFRNLSTSDIIDGESKLIETMQALAQVSDIEEYQSPDLASRLADSGNYELQVASHQTLARLRIFCHDLVRSLRNISSYKA